MSFVSVEFLVLFAVVAPLYYMLPLSYANLMLLAASYFFYAYWNPPYLLLLIGTTLCDYRLALAIDRASSERVRRILLTVSLLLNFGILATFKYSGLISGHAVRLVLPIGISFYTFQEVSYVVDVYRRRIAAAARFRDLSLFISFFPQLIAGPIERAGAMLPQFARKHALSEENVAAGLRLMLFGFFKKLVIADRLADYVNSVYDAPASHDPAALLVATVFFAAQIYADFSAYSDIAIGAARVMGFSLMNNFRQPYFSESVSEFWHRWHISLSTWFRDYVYIPLGGNRVPALRRHVNVLVVFLLSGLWHGAHVKFVLWGALHGAAVTAESLSAGIGRVSRILASSAARPFRHLVTLSFVCVAWVPFRAASIADTLYIWRHLVPVHLPLRAVVVPAGTAQLFIGTLCGLVLLFVADAVDASGGLWPRFERCPRAVRWTFYYAASYGVLWLGAWGRRDFIYFHF